VVVRRTLLLLVAVASAGLLLGAALLVRSLDSPGTQHALLDKASAAIGAPVKARKLELSLFSGLRLEGVTIQAPAPARGELLSADAFVLRYELLPLLRGRLELQRLALQKPRIRLTRDARGAIDYPRPAGNRAGPAAPTSSRGMPLTLVLSHVSVKDGSLRVVDETGTAALEVDQLSLESGVEVTSGGVAGNGEVKLGRTRLASGFTVTDLDAPLTFRGRDVRLAPLKARVADGRFSGDLSLGLGDPARQVADVRLEGAQLQKLLQDTKSQRGFSGKLSATASLEGAGTLESFKGHGQASVDDCKVEHDAILSLLADTLHVPELRQPEFRECRIEFTLAQAVLTNPVISLKGAAVELTGQGTTNLHTQALDYRMNLALAEAVLTRVPVAEVRAAFKDRGDGFSGLDFSIGGTTAQPHVDILGRITKAAATEAAKTGIGRLWDKLTKH
jgi:hypothetical protein